MIDPKQPNDPSDERLIEHLRQHTHAEPPAALDAFILAAAHREAPTPAPSLWQRWLQACQRPRWQMAFATVVGVALMIGLVLRSPVPTQEEVSSPTAMDFSARREEPSVAAAPPPAPVVRMAPQGELVPAPASPMQALADKPAAKMSKAVPAAPPSLEQGLRQILRLRQAGDAKAADEQLLALHKRFPQEDLPARLEALQKSEE